ncbi:acyl-CoA dehydrogenase family protein [Sporolactobacillus sp. THM19-2]|uniref:acyl-CoA dehydrogenase family protein n=1 Tax=Sporolactobacillus sp. THM19-2 TaxID=2511171 RepID=UPI00101F365B|nr:acyl-CoA dehydrogenase family protein [Sporolactobacillus sp. THM19-2]RYL90277.1 acyl-CoA dehydrogenase [Sporolactobacillus sp. THM19-2]
MALKRKQTGAHFLIEETDPNGLIFPEDFSEEQRMFAETTQSFIEKEVVPNDEQIERLDYELTVELIRKAGELGILAVDVPEAFGGLGADKVSSTVITESLARGSSFSLSASAHSGIGTLPIVFFGNDEQKKKYLPDLAGGVKIAAYCLTEPSSGSDALSAKTTAKLSDDGKYYVLNGEKQFITNAGFADIFIVYARIGGKDFSAFIVEREMPGLSLGPEEKKMGIKGSSTRPVILEDVNVPVENLLGEAGKGHVIAFNILNIGRFKLAAGVLGAAKDAIRLAAKFANERTQFKKPLSFFPLIRQKLAEMNTRTYALESMVYRTSGLIDTSLKDLDYSSPDIGLQSAKGIAEYAIECSINKVFGSETLDFVADEGVQIHGGYGFTKDYKIERIYRDSRINRIFEGTNEINRLVIISTLQKKVMKGDLPLLEKAVTLKAEIEDLLAGKPEAHGPGQEAWLISAAKKVFLLVLGQAFQKYGVKLQSEQQLLSHLSDMIIQIYAMESSFLRSVKRLEKMGAEKAKNSSEMTQLIVQEGFNQVETLASESLAKIESGESLLRQLVLLRKITNRLPINSLQLKLDIGTRVAEAEKYSV